MTSFKKIKFLLEGCGLFLGNCPILPLIRIHHRHNTGLTARDTITLYPWSVPGGPHATTLVDNTSLPPPPPWVYWRIVPKTKRPKRMVPARTGFWKKQHPRNYIFWFSGLRDPPGHNVIWSTCLLINLSSGQPAFWSNCLLVNLPSGPTAFWSTCLLVNLPSGPLVF